VKIGGEEIRMNKLDKLIVSSLGACIRRVSNTWINPAKSRVYYEDLKRVFFKDESPEGLYPACVVPKYMLGQTVAIIPIEKFVELLSAWKKLHPDYVKALETVSLFY